jgi:serine protease Do
MMINVCLRYRARFATLVALLITLRASHGLADQRNTRHSLDRAHLNDLFRGAVDRVSPAIVTISTISGPRATPEWAMRDLPAEERANVEVPRLGEAPMYNMPFDPSGSGIVFDERGYIVTCAHVVESAEHIFVHLSDGRRLEPTKVLVDPMTDIAILKLPASTHLTAAPIGDSDTLRPGDWVISVGNPYRLGISMSAGIVSATQRHLPDASRARLIQSDAATNPGNSGGALVDLDGTIVGISEGSYGVNEGFQGIGFAIPINDVRRIAKQLIENGSIERTYLGCSTQEIKIDICKHLGHSLTSGLIVTDVAPMTAAEKGGIEVGDVITHVSGKPIVGGFRLADAMETLSPGDELKLTIFRNGVSFALRIKVDALETANAKPRSLTKVSKPSEGYYHSELGMVVDDAPAALTERLHYPSSVSGVLVTYVEPRSIASKEGICAGMLIARVGNKLISSSADLQRELQAHSLSEGYLILVATPTRKKFVLMKTE